MKLFRELKSLFNYYDLQDLEYFYELLQTRVKDFIYEETTGNDRISGLIWMIMAACVERIIPQSNSYTRLTKKQREEFVDLAAEKIKTLSEKLYNASNMSKEEKNSIMFSIYTMKFLITLAKEDQLF